jgi:UTP:GlnB (protein PII) uridylyltransferase
MDLDVALAKIATEVDHAVDVFYVTEKQGSKVAEGSRMEQIREALMRAIAEGIA